MNPLRLPYIAALLTAVCASATGCVAATPNATAACKTGHVPSADPATDAKLRAVIASADRPAAEVMRDKYRHPRETLEFFGIRSAMSVVELWPGAGWYTAILAPLLAEKGKLAVTEVDSADAPHGEAGMGEGYKQRLASKPGVFGKVEVREIHPNGDLTFGPDGSADAVVTFRSVHGWIHHGIADKVFAAAFRVLKPGGILGVAEHRAKADADPMKAGDTGYVPEKY
ncbi:MAG: class I SAM-dependent methyltransferase, partial [Polyangiaceae bacterium]